MNLKKISEEAKHEFNPFYKEIKGKMFLRPKSDTIIGKKDAVVDTSTGEIKADVVMASRKIVDKSQFAKLYASEIGLLFDLSKPAINVFMYLSKVMNYENNAFFMYTSQFKKIGYKSYIPCLKGIRELLTKNIIAIDLKPHHYWLHPAIVCKGERFSKFIQYEVGTPTLFDDNKDTANKYLIAQNKKIMEKADDKTGKKLTEMNKKTAEEYHSEI